MMFHRLERRKIIRGRLQTTGPLQSSIQFGPATNTQHASIRQPRNCACRLCARRRGREIRENAISNIGAQLAEIPIMIVLLPALLALPPLPRLSELELPSVPGFTTRKYPAKYEWMREDREPWLPEWQTLCDLLPKVPLSSSQANKIPSHLLDDFIALMEKHSSDPIATEHRKRLDLGLRRFPHTSRPTNEYTNGLEIDFGTAHAWLCAGAPNLSKFGSTLMEREMDAKLGTLQPGAGDSIEITNPYEVEPRRLWDLYSNRVIPYSWAVGPSEGEGPKFWAVSHSWAADDDRKEHWTPINKEQWKVPLPKGVSLENVREELLRLSGSKVRYFWLDILCLRQPVDIKDADRFGPKWATRVGKLRALEVMVDIPTIGNIFQQAENIVVYFNGLGRPFCTERAVWDSDYHWTKRAWTLQEYTREVDSMLIGGLDPERGGRLCPRLKLKGASSTELSIIDELKQLPNASSKTKSGGIMQLTYEDLVHAVKEMKQRRAKNEMDKVIGLSYWLQFERIPVYRSGESVEDAWDRCVGSMPTHVKELLLFHSPCVSSRDHWWPSWRQLASESSPNHDVSQLRKAVARFTSFMKALWTPPVLSFILTSGILTGHDQCYTEKGRVVMKGLYPLDPSQIGQRQLCYSREYAFQPAKPVIEIADGNYVLLWPPKLSSSDSPETLVGPVLCQQLDVRMSTSGGRDGRPIVVYVLRKLAPVRVTSSRLQQGILFQVPGLDYTPEGRILGSACSVAFL